MWMKGEEKFMCSDLPMFCCLLNLNVMLCTTVQSVYVSAVCIAAIPICCYRMVCIDILFTFVKKIVPFLYVVWLSVMKFGMMSVASLK